MRILDVLDFAVQRIFFSQFFSRLARSPTLTVSRAGGRHSRLSRVSHSKVHISLSRVAISELGSVSLALSRARVSARKPSLSAVSAAIDVRATVTHAHLCPPRHGLEQPALLRALLHRASERLHRTRLAEGGACTVKGGRLARAAEAMAGHGAGLHLSWGHLAARSRLARPERG